MKYLTRHISSYYKNSVNTQSSNILPKYTFYYILHLRDYKKPLNKLQILKLVVINNTLKTFLNIPGYPTTYTSICFDHSVK